MCDQLYLRHVGYQQMSLDIMCLKIGCKTEKTGVRIKHVIVKRLKWLSQKDALATPGNFRVIFEGYSRLCVLNAQAIGTFDRELHGH